jgi:hypothetical protein
MTTLGIWRGVESEAAVRDGVWAQAGIKATREKVAADIYAPQWQNPQDAFNGWRMWQTLQDAGISIYSGRRVTTGGDANPLNFDWTLANKPHLLEKIFTADDQGTEASRNERNATFDEIRAYAPTSEVFAYCGGNIFQAYYRMYVAGATTPQLRAGPGTPEWADYTIDGRDKAAHLCVNVPPLVDVWGPSWLHGSVYAARAGQGMNLDDRYRPQDLKSLGPLTLDNIQIVTRQDGTQYLKSDPITTKVLLDKDDSNGSAELTMQYLRDLKSIGKKPHVLVDFCPHYLIGAFGTAPSPKAQAAYYGKLFMMCRSHGVETLWLRAVTATGSTNYLSRGYGSPALDAQGTAAFIEFCQEVLAAGGAQ